jgi:cystathionine beta-lyase
MPWPLVGQIDADRFAVRLWIGLEDQADLKADIERGLAAWNAA